VFLYAITNLVNSNKRTVFHAVELRALNVAVTIWEAGVGTADANPVGQIPNAVHQGSSGDIEIAVFAQDSHLLDHLDQGGGAVIAVPGEGRQLTGANAISIFYISGQMMFFRVSLVGYVGWRGRSLRHLHPHD